MAETFVVEVKCGKEKSEENSAANGAAYKDGSVVSRTRRLRDFYGSHARGIEECGESGLGKAIERGFGCSITVWSDHIFGSVGWRLTSAP